MNESRVIRLLRELRCDPIARWCEEILGIAVAPASGTQDALPAAESTQPAPEEGSEIESWLM